MVLSISGLTWSGTSMRAPASERLVSPSVTCPARFGSIRQAAASLGREVMTTLPLISALALSALMFTLPICLATLPPSRLPSASPTAPVAFDDSDPVTSSFPVSGVASDNRSWAPVAVIGPREAVQPMSAFCRICDTGLSALPAKVRGAPRSAASRIAGSAIATWAMMLEIRGADGSGGNSTSTGAGTEPRGDSQSMAFRLIKNETATTAIASRIVLRLTAKRIVPPYWLHRRVYRAGSGGARVAEGGTPQSLIRDNTTQGARTDANPFELLPAGNKKWRAASAPFFV